MSIYQKRLDALRSELRKQSLDAFVIPLTDEHMSEYVGDYAKRLAFISGFTGSAGNAVVTLSAAAIFVDGRYTIQVANEVDGTLFERHHFEARPLLQWLRETVKEGGQVGYDPELATLPWVEEATDKLAHKNIALVAVSQNPVDAIWHDQPSAPQAKAYPHPDIYSGQSAEEKRSDLGQLIKQAGADSAVVTMLDSVAWAFNMRGDDVRNTPVTQSFAILNKDETADLFISSEKVDDTLRSHLGNRVRIRDRADFYPALRELGEANKSVLFDPKTNNSAVHQSLCESGATILKGDDPCILMKARKNRTEQMGARSAHIRDGAAIAEFLCWFAEEAPKETLDELKAAQKLWEFRQKRDLITGISFDTISAAGPNGALCHYSVTERTNRPIRLGELFLIDSGGQYLDGTTDITRTLAVGHPSREMKKNFTRVLKGHIALATTRFPIGTPGMALDAIARRPLWDAGLDYDHGTGHGVGSFLAVHEGPQRIAKFGTSVPLEAGMILSNEPGYYKEGSYGIRIENLVLIVASDNVGERPMLEFENLTWAPIDLALVDPLIMTRLEIDWLNDYHRLVWEKISPEVDGKTRQWLEAATKPITRPH
ncbi:aminopeptidase P family protein [Kordiimonas sediminis]|nr:aminopeptidase P family protein [Kordiimonas sediminis]